MDALLFKIPFHIGGVFAAGHHIQIEPVGILVIQDHLHHIIRFAGGRIGGEAGDHAADLAAGQDLVPLLDGQRIGNELMVQALKDRVLIVLFLIFDQAHTVVGVELAGIELIEGQPVIHPVAQTLEQGAGVAHITLHRLAALPAAVLCYQMQRDIVVQDGSEHLDAMGVAGIKQIHIKLQTCLVGLRIIAIGEDACPADGGAQHLDAQLCKQFQIFLPAVIKIDTMTERIMLQILKVCKSSLEFFIVHAAVGFLGALFLRPIGVEIPQILRIQPFAVLQKRTFCLRGCHGTAPEKVFRKTCFHHDTLLSYCSFLFITREITKPDTHAIAITISNLKKLLPPST